MSNEYIYGKSEEEIPKNQEKQRNRAMVYIAVVLLATTLTLICLYLLKEKISLTFNVFSSLLLFIVLSILIGIGVKHIKGIKEIQTPLVVAAVCTYIATVTIFCLVVGAGVEQTQIAPQHIPVATKQCLGDTCTYFPGSHKFVLKAGQKSEWIQLPKHRNTGYLFSSFQGSNYAIIFEDGTKKGMNEIHSLSSCKKFKIEAFADSTVHLDLS